MLYKYLVIGVISVLSLAGANLIIAKGPSKATPAKPATPASPKNNGEVVPAQPATPATPPEKTVIPPQKNEAFNIGDKIQTIENVRVRLSPVLSSPISGIQSSGSYGKIIGGPDYSDDYIWWRIDFPQGFDGWSVQNGIKIVSPRPKTENEPTPTPTTSPLPTITPDIIPPSIFNINSRNIDPFSVDISWETNEPADGQVEFINGPCPGVTYCLTPIVPTLITKHLINIYNLLPGLEYIYRVKSTDASNNLATSSSRSFFTLTPTTTPIISLSPSPTATISFTPPPPPTYYEGKIKQITLNSADQEQPSVSGDKIVWTDYRNGTSDIYMYDLIAGIETRISYGPGNESHPHIDGNFVVYQDTRPDPNNPGYSITNAYLYDIAKKTAKIMGLGSMPKISGNQIVYTNFLTRNLYLYDIASGSPGFISHMRDTPYISGTTIISKGELSAGISGLYAYDIQTKTERLLTSGNYPFRASIDNTTIAYTKRSTNTSLGYDIYTYSLLENKERNVTNRGGRELGSISISGNRIVWTDTGDYNIYLQDITTNQLIQLTSHTAQQYHSYIDDNRVVWADYRNGNFDIYMLEL